MNLWKKIKSDCFNAIFSDISNVFCEYPMNDMKK